MILGIDTTGEACSVVLLDEGKRPVSNTFCLLGSGHAEALFPMLSDLFEEAGISRDQVARVIVTTGPGSFTGVRVGLSAARGLGLGLSCPVHGISVLSLLAAQAFAVDDDLEALIVANDARRSQVYVQSFGRPVAGGLKELDAAKIVSLDELNTLLGAAGKKIKQLVGSAARLIPKDIAPAIEVRELFPDMVALGDALWLFGEDYFSPAPRAFYLRPPDAQPQTAPAWLQKQG